MSSTDIDNSTALVLTNRLYKYIKSSAVVNIIQAAVELITNSDDAYRKMVSHTGPKRIDVIVDYQKHTMVCFDQACGLCCEDMTKCFGQVGSYTSTVNSRGYFSRGAKDITAIGNATFVGIRDSMISEVSLSSTDMFNSIRSDDTITSTEREEYGIQENGLWVELSVKSSSTFPSLEELLNMSGYFSLRDIFSDPDTFLNLKVIDEIGNIAHDDRVVYNPPKVSQLLIDQVYDVEGYPGIKAKFTLELLENPSPGEYGSYMQHGILVSSGNALHEVSTLYGDVRNHPYIKKVRGRIECSHINQLMYDFDSNPDDVSNPFPVLDHSRLNGMDRSHPFTKALFRIPHRQLKYILQELYTDGSVSENFSDNIASLFKDVELFGSEYFKEMMDLMYNYKVSDHGKIVGYLTKKATSVVSVSSEAKYNFSDPSKTFERVDEKGDVTKDEPSLSVIFTDKDFLEFPYYIYRIDNNIYLEININDFMVSKYISKSDEDGKIVFKNKLAGSIVLIDIIAEAFARESIKEKTSNSNDSDAEKVFSELEKLRKMLIPQLFKLIVTDEMATLNIVSE